MTAPGTTPTMPRPRLLRDRLAHLRDDDAGMSTAEYAIGTIAAAAFGALLYTVIAGEGHTVRLCLARRWHCPWCSTAGPRRSETSGPRAWTISSSSCGAGPRGRAGRFTPSGV